jgi:hypothetical protein
MSPYSIAVCAKADAGAATITAVIASVATSDPKVLRTVDLQLVGPAWIHRPFRTDSSIWITDLTKRARAAFQSPVDGYLSAR